jgi:hypothetical protein
MMSGGKGNYGEDDDAGNGKGKVRITGLNYI